MEGMSEEGEKTLKATTLFLTLTFEMHKFNFRKVFSLSFVPWMIRSMMDLMIKFKVIWFESTLKVCKTAGFFEKWKFKWFEVFTIASSNLPGREVGILLWVGRHSQFDQRGS